MAAVSLEGVTVTFAFILSADWTKLTTKLELKNPDPAKVKVDAAPSIIFIDPPYKEIIEWCRAIIEKPYVTDKPIFRSPMLANPLDENDYKLINWIHDDLVFVIDKLF